MHNLHTVNQCNHFSAHTTDTPHYYISASPQDYIYSKTLQTYTATLQFRQYTLHMLSCQRARELYMDLYKYVPLRLHQNYPYTSNTTIKFLLIKIYFKSKFLQFHRHSDKSHIMTISICIFNNRK
jgi:hypothetical protein